MELKQKAVARVESVCTNLAQLLLVEILAGEGTSLAGVWWEENSNLEGDW